ncbi:S41 family peptidase [Aurantibacter aestuarii]|uniref:Peptidase S41 n=1 Tax=Aurantibacter aestuarii TaxID=1266046 RepID=A0A2T1NCZ9_9FLAO|nr:S41 family peptidase [Aurantibacter aestuarii]PSG90315.1 peptidase S41 [Aurantibacter aestuarii]
MKKKIVQFIVLPVVAIFIFISTTAYNNDFFEIAKQIEIFTTLFKEVNMNYVDDTNPADLMDTAIKSMLEDLDPYTNFYNEQDVEAERIRRTGDYSGIGAHIATLKDKVVIIEAYKDYPADKAGLKAGDEIIKVDGTLLADYKEDALDLLKGAPNSKISVEYFRQGKTFTAEVSRSEREIDAVPHFSLINEQVGYIVLSKFNQKTTTQTIYALKDLKAQGAKQIILDLRGNPGGLLSEAVNIVNLFVPKGQVVVTTKSKIKEYNKTYTTQNEPLDLNIPVVVLIDGKSASASEIVAGTLQDLDRAVIVGSRSFGKGLVQRVKKLTYGTQFKVTISRYYTPSGRCIQALDYRNRDDKGNAIRKKEDNFSEFTTKNGRKVFDGGGVMPDKVLANTKNSAITRAILDNQSIFDFATEFYYSNSIPNINTFKFSDAHFNEFKNFLKSSGFNFKTETELALEKALEVAKNEQLDDDIKKDYNALLKNIEASKLEAIDDNKSQLVNLLTEEIVKRYAYREGLYEYYKIHNEEIKTASAILQNPNTYNSYLK